MLRRTMLQILKISSLLVSVITFSAFAASQSDFTKNIEIDSRYSAVNAIKRTSIFREDVHIVQGTLTIDAEEVEVIASNGKGQEVFVAKGSPATYRQTLDNGSVISAQANEIQYRVIDRTLTLSGQAELQQDSSKVQSDTIVFNIEKQELVAQGGNTSEDRVRTIFNPSDFPAINSEQSKELQ